MGNSDGETPTVTHWHRQGGLEESGCVVNATGAAPVLAPLGSAKK
jgi:hypothetical protein